MGNKGERIREEGLWAFFGGRFYEMTLHPENRQMDHATWFRELNLPDHGEEFDRILRGRVTWDRHFDEYVLTFYGAHYLPNQIYQMVNRRFNPHGEPIVEKPAAEHWR